MWIGTDGASPERALFNGHSADFLSYSSTGYPIVFIRVFLGSWYCPRYWRPASSPAKEERHDRGKPRLSVAIHWVGWCLMVLLSLALPGGTQVMTDEIVKLAHHDDELSAVAAHGLGHVQHCHALRHGQASAGVVLLAQVLADHRAASPTSCCAWIPPIRRRENASKHFRRKSLSHGAARMRQFFFRGCISSC